MRNLIFCYANLARCHVRLGWDELGVSLEGVDDEGLVGLSATMVTQRFWVSTMRDLVATTKGLE
jgi:hypothetical protein